MGLFSKSVQRQQRAVVTGAGSGIGRAFALEIASNGGQVVCADLNLERAEDTLKLIRQAGGEGLATQVDVAKAEAMQALADTAQAYFGQAPTLIVNNAGVGAGGEPIGQVSLEDWRWVMDVNFWGVVHGCHAFAPLLREAGFGGVINVCSTASFSAAPTMGPYNASKAAALAVTETLAAELAGVDVSVTALCPTFVKTNILKNGRVHGGASTLAGQVMDRWAFTPERVARQALQAMERSDLYVVPQMDAKAIWGFKRLLPSIYTRGAGQLTRLIGASRSTKATSTPSTPSSSQARPQRRSA